MLELSVDKVSKLYNNKLAVNSVSFKVNEGIYGFLGANGSGKTTLMKMICGILKATSGSIRVNGKNIIEMDEKFREIIGYLPQGFGYYPDFKAEEFLLYISSIKGLERKFAKKRTEDLLDIVGLNHVANKKIKTFSGGMKQRLGIAQALLNNPKILILDEPTVGLDPKERVKFRNLLSDFSKDKIVILSTHIVSDVEYIANKVLIIKKGEITLNGPVDALKSKMNKKVWKIILTPKELNSIEHKYCIANVQHNHDSVELRVISDKKPIKSAESLDATLEDLYLYHFQDIINTTEGSNNNGNIS